MCGKSTKLSVYNCIYFLCIASRQVRERGPEPSSLVPSTPDPLHSGHVAGQTLVSFKMRTKTHFVIIY